MLRKKVYFCFILLLIFLFLMGTGTMRPVTAEGLSEEEARQLLIRTDRNSEPLEYEGLMVMKNSQTGLEPQEIEARLIKKDDKMLVIFLEPPGQRGQVFIRNADDMWMYLPRSKKVMRIGAKDASMGGEASNADVMRTALADDYSPVYLGDEVMDNVNCYKLELRAQRRTIAYDKVIYWISKEKELPVRREYYALSGKKLRIMCFREVKVLGGQERPTRIRIENAAKKEYWTEIILKEIITDFKYEDYVFTPAYVRQGLLH